VELVVVVILTKPQVVEVEQEEQVEINVVLQVALVVLEHHQE
jgi:hypothetical protein